VADNRTEKATQRKRLKAREHGQVLRSRDLVSALTLLGLIAALSWRSELGLVRWQVYFKNVMNWACCTEMAGGIPLLTLTATTVVVWAGPFLAVAFAVAIAGTLAQGAPTFAAEALSLVWHWLAPFV
jgi:flagellar biosynthesis protein FlhB